MIVYNCEGSIRSTHVETGKYLGVRKCDNPALFTIQGWGSTRYWTYNLCPRCLHMALSTKSLTETVVTAIDVDITNMFSDLEKELDDVA